MRPIDKFILHVVHNLIPLNEYNEGIMRRLMDHYKEEADDLNINISDEQLKKYIERFDTLKPSIIAKGGTELFKQVGGEKKIEVTVPLSQLIKIITSSPGADIEEEPEDLTPDVVYHNDNNSIIVYNGAKEGNCMNYGSGEKWCITRGSYSNYRYNENRSFPTFYLAKNKNLPSSDSLSFVAIQVRNPQTTSETQRYIYTNRKNSPYESSPMSLSQLENEVPWLREIPNLNQVLKYIPLSTGEKISQKYRHSPISIKEWVKLPFNIKQQYLIVRKTGDFFTDISNDEFISKYLPKYPQLARFVAITPGVVEPITLLKNLEAFNNQDRKSVTANIQTPIDTKYLKRLDLPFDVKKLLVALNKWDLNKNQRIYVTKDGKAIVLLNVGNNINIGVYTEEDDYPSIKLNQRTSKYLLDYPELDKIPFDTLVNLTDDNILSKEVLNQVIENSKNDPKSNIVAQDTEDGTIIIDSNYLTAYKWKDGKISKLPFDDEEVQDLFNEKKDNEDFQQNLVNNLFKIYQDIPASVNRADLIPLLNSTAYPKRTITTTYADTPLVILTTNEDNPKIFTALSSIQNVGGDQLLKTLADWGYYSNWRDSRRGNVVMDTPKINAYLTYLQNQNQTFTDDQLVSISKAQDISTNIKKSLLTNPNLPLDQTNRYIPTEYDGVVYLVNTQDSTNSAKISNTTGNLLKANIPANKVNRLLGRQPQTEPEAEVEPAVAQLQALTAQGGAPRRGRPRGVPNAPREPQERQRGDINVADAFDERGLRIGFGSLPRNDFRRLNVNDAVALNRIGDRGASARDNLLGGQGRVTNVISVGPSKIYFIRLNNDTRIASINIQPGNRNYVVVGGRSYSLNSPRDLVNFLQQRNILEALRKSMVKLYLQENPHMIDEMKNLKENISQEAATIHAMLQTGQQSAQDFIDSNNVDARKLIDYIKQYKGESRESIIRDVITGNVRDYNPQSLKQFKDMFLKKIKNKNMRINEFKSLVREVVKKKLAENQPAPSRENPDRETIERGTEEEKDKKRRRIGNPDVEPRPKAMNENEQEIIKQIVARFKSKK